MTRDPEADVELPPRFADALGIVRAAVSDCQRAGIPEASVIAGLMVELMPRLVDFYGPRAVAVVLEQLAGEIAGAPAAGCLRQ